MTNGMRDILNGGIGMTKPEILAAGKLFTAYALK